MAAGRPEYRDLNQLRLVLGNFYYVPLYSCSFVTIKVIRLDTVRWRRGCFDESRSITCSKVTQFTLHIPPYPSGRQRAPSNGLPTPKIGRPKETHADCREPCEQTGAQGER